MSFRFSILTFAVCAVVTVGAWALWPRGAGVPHTTVQAGGDAFRENLLFQPDQPVALRMEAARQIDGSLSLEVILAWLRQVKDVPEAPLSSANFLIYNEIIERCRAGNLHPSDLGAFLTAAVEDHSLHPVVRDYSAQHLALWLTPEPKGAPGEDSAPRRVEGAAALARAAADPAAFHTTLPGTALMALADMERRGVPLVSGVWTTLDPLVTGWISSRDTPLALRLSAIQSAASARRAAQLPAIRALVSSPDTPDGVLFCAVAALGRMGNSATDHSPLRAIADSSSPAKAAALAALNHLRP